MEKLLNVLQVILFAVIAKWLEKPKTQEKIAKLVELELDRGLDEALAPPPAESS